MSKRVCSLLEIKKKKGRNNLLAQMTDNIFRSLMFMYLKLIIVDISAFFGGKKKNMARHLIEKEWAFSVMVNVYREPSCQQQGCWPFTVGTIVILSRMPLIWTPLCRVISSLALFF